MDGISMSRLKHFLAYLVYTGVLVDFEIGPAEDRGKYKVHLTHNAFKEDNKMYVVICLFLEDTNLEDLKNTIYNGIIANHSQYLDVNM